MNTISGIFGGSLALAMLATGSATESQQPTNGDFNQQVNAVYYTYATNCRPDTPHNADATPALVRQQEKLLDNLGCYAYGKVIVRSYNIVDRTFNERNVAIDQVSDTVLGWRIEAIAYAYYLNDLMRMTCQEEVDQLSGGDAGFTIYETIQYDNLIERLDNYSWENYLSNGSAMAITMRIVGLVAEQRATNCGAVETIYGRALAAIEEAEQMQALFSTKTE